MHIFYRKIYTPKPGKYQVKKLFHIVRYMSKEFFIIKFKTLPYFIFIGKMILINDSNRETQKLLKSYINKNLNFHT